MSDELERALALRDTDSKAAEERLLHLARQKVEKNDEEGIRIQEEALSQLGSHLAKLQKGDELAQVIKDTILSPPLVSKAKAAKLIRHLVDQFLEMENAEISKKIDLGK